MDSRVAYLNIWQILSDQALSTATEPAKNVPLKRIPSPEEYNAPLNVHIARNCVSAGQHDISHITWEFEAIQGMFMGCATFDGTGPYGTGPNKFAMPGQKINLAQKALILLTLMEYSMSATVMANGIWVEPADYVSGSFTKLKAKIQQEFDGGVSDLSLNYDQICRTSRGLIANDLNGGKVVSRA